MDRQALPLQREAYRAFRTMTTRWMDNDIYGHMNNVVHYSLFDTAVIGIPHPDFGEGEQPSLSRRSGLISMKGQY